MTAPLTPSQARAMARLVAVWPDSIDPGRAREPTKAACEALVRAGLAVRVGWLGGFVTYQATPEAGLVARHGAEGWAKPGYLRLWCRQIVAMGRLLARMMRCPLPAYTPSADPIAGGLRLDVSDTPRGYVHMVMRFAFDDITRSLCDGQLHETGTKALVALLATAYRTGRAGPYEAPGRDVADGLHADAHDPLSRAMRGWGPRPAWEII